jgi:D-alanyl-D-alanine carboxypeptidase/D-alanyl-D-alanine-endopeptidase (penicillin-binding protein 4)
MPLTSEMNRRLLALLLLPLACVTPRSATKPVDLLSRLDVLLQAAEAQGSNVAAYVIDAKTGVPLYAHREHARSNSASTMKLASTAAALAALGADYRFHTVIALQGKRTKDFFDGDLVVTASGDPTFGSRQFPRTDSLPRYIAEALLAKGIKRWRGSVRIVGAETPPGDALGPGWAWDDVARDYSGPTGPFVFHDNVVQVVAHRGKGVANVVPEICGPITVRVDPLLARPKVDVQVRGSEQNEGLDCLRDYVSADVHCTWLLPPSPCAQRSTEWVSVDSPAALFETAFLSALNDAAIVHVAGPATVATTSEVLLDVESPPLSDIVRVTNKHSLNLYAERLAMAVAKARTGNEGYSVLQTVLAQDQAERGIDPHDFTQVDGSGLSRYNLVTASGLVQLLKSCLGTRYEYPLIASLPITGMEGTLRLHQLESPARAWAKTGTLTGQRGFAGFIERPGDAAHPTLIFALLIGNTMGLRQETNTVFDRFVEIVALAPYAPRR